MVTRCRLTNEERRLLTDFIKKRHAAGEDMDDQVVADAFNRSGSAAGKDVKAFAVAMLRKKAGIKFQKGPRGAHKKGPDGISKGDPPPRADGESDDDAAEEARELAATPAEELAGDDDPTFENFMRKLRDVVKFGEKVQKRFKKHAGKSFF
jgi:hypothetical protein